MPIIRIATAFNIDLEFEIAAFHKRLLAYLIDFTLLILYMICMKSLLYTALGLDPEYSMGLDMILVTLPMLLYSFLFELLMNGQTLGKRLMAIRVISMDGGEPTMGQFMLRWITKFFEWPFLFGYIVSSEKAVLFYIIATGFFGIAVVVAISVTKNSQRLGDLAAGTVVVDTKSSLGISDTVFMDVQNENYVVHFPEVMRLTDGDINTIKSVLTQSRKRKNDELSYRVEAKVKQVLNIRSNLPPNEFLEKLLEDYNYLATREN